MIDFSFLFLSLTVATFLPAYAALYLLPALRKVPIRYLAAAGVGLAFWYFFDAMGDANSLGENNSLFPPYLFGGFPHLLLIASFVFGISMLAILDRSAVRAVGWPWSDAVAPSVLKKARRLRCASR